MSNILCRGEIQATFYKVNGVASKVYEVGDRVVQIVIIPHPVVQLKVVDELSDSDRGKGGFGSTGK